MEDIKTLQEIYDRDKRRCMLFGQVLFIHVFFTASWFILMIVLKLSKSKVEDLIFILMLVAAYIMGYLYRNLKKKVKESWTLYNKEKNRINKLKSLQINDGENMRKVVQ
jgi:hypothetical protein